MIADVSGNGTLIFYDDSDYENQELTEAQKEESRKIIRQLKGEDN
jgi:predicted transcriptional regulator